MSNYEEAEEYIMSNFNQAKKRIKINKMSERNIIEIIRKSAEANIDTSNLLYCPAMPVVMGMERTFIIEEFMGMKVARLVSAGEEE